MNTSLSRRLVICDPTLLWAEAVAALVRLHTGWQVACATTRIEAALAAVEGAQALLFDLPDSEPERLEGFIQQLHTVGADVAPMLLTASVKPQFLRSALGAGVRVCVHKSEPYSILVAALRAVREGRSYVSPAIHRALVSGHRPVRQVAVACTLAALALFAAAPRADAAGEQSVRIHFDAVVGSAPFGCGRSYDGIGLTRSRVTPTDFRFFVSGVELLRADGQVVAVSLQQDGRWQQRDVALLDFEDGSGPCNNGNADLRSEVRGTVPKGRYRGLRFTLGVPFDLNHADATLAASPLNITAMFWVWRAGYRFLKVDMATSGMPDRRMDLLPGSAAMDKEEAIGFPVHLGSAGCVAPTPTTAPTYCQAPNRPRIVFAAFDPSRDVVVADLATLLGNTNVDMNQHNTAPGCMSEPDDVDCAGIMAALGLRDGPQRFFSVRERPTR